MTKKVFYKPIVKGWLLVTRCSCQACACLTSLSRHNPETRALSSPTCHSRWELSLTDIPIPLLKPAIICSFYRVVFLSSYLLTLRWCTLHAQAVFFFFIDVKFRRGNVYCTEWDYSKYPMCKQKPVKICKRPWVCTFMQFITAFCHRLTNTILTLQCSWCDWDQEVFSVL